MPHSFGTLVRYATDIRNRARMCSRNAAPPTSTQGLSENIYESHIFNRYNNACLGVSANILAFTSLCRSRLMLLSMMCAA